MAEERNESQLEQLMAYYMQEAQKAEPGSKEMTALNDAYVKLWEKLQKENEIELAFDKFSQEVEDAKLRKEEDAKEKKWRKKIDVAQIVAPAATGLAGLGAVLIFEMKDVITSKAGMSWIGKLLKWTK